MTRARAGGPPVEAARASTVAWSEGSAAVIGGRAGRGVRPAHSVPIGRRRITGTCAMMRSCVQISPATAS